MNTWFECKVKYEKVKPNGKEAMVTETYLIDAVSFTDAEARIHKELEPYITGEFYVTQIKIANYAELFPNADGDRWFKCKVSFITLDEEKGVEKKTNVYMLVQANNSGEALQCVDECLDGTVSVYEKPAVNETNIMDVFMYFKDDKKEGEIPAKNLKPVKDLPKIEEAE